MPGIGAWIAAQQAAASTPAVASAVAAVQKKLKHEYPKWGEVEQTLTIVPTPTPVTPVQQAAEVTGIPIVLEKLGVAPITPEGVFTFAAPPLTEAQTIAQFIPVLEKLGMPVSEPTIAGIEAAIGKQYEAPIHEGVPLIGGMDVGIPDVLGGLKDTLIIAAVAIGGLFILSKYVGGKR